MTRHDADPTPRDDADDRPAGRDGDDAEDGDTATGRTEDDEVRRLDRELAVANDLAPDDTRRDEPGIAPRDAS